MKQHLKDRALERGLVKAKIVAVLAEAVFARVGWELDNYGWIVKTEKGEVTALTTDHGSVCAWDLEDMAEVRKDTQEHLESLDKAIALFTLESTR